MCKVYARVCGLLIAHLHLLPTYRCIDFNELRLTNKSLKILMQPLALILYFVFLFSYFFFFFNNNSCWTHCLCKNGCRTKLSGTWKVQLHCVANAKCSLCTQIQCKSVLRQTNVCLLHCAHQWNNAYKAQKEKKPSRVRQAGNSITVFSMPSRNHKVKKYF